MTVKELIEKLEQFGEHHEVSILVQELNEETGDEEVVNPVKDVDFSEAYNAVIIE